MQQSTRFVTFNTGSPSSKYEYRRTSAMLRNIRNIRICTGGGGGTAIYGSFGMCRCEGYGFQAVYSRVGCINQSVWV